MLGWEPSVPLEQGLVQTIAYFENLLAGRASIYA
jgi:nucleoside-diphosphate-sugar epimerase